MAKKYKLTNDVFVLCDEKDCVFCEHCTDIFWDFSNGIYLRICELEKEQINGNCEHFKEVQDGE